LKRRNLEPTVHTGDYSGRIYGDYYRQCAQGCIGVFEEVTLQQQQQQQQGE